MYMLLSNDIVVRYLHGVILDELAMKQKLLHLTNVKLEMGSFRFISKEFGESKGSRKFHVHFQFVYDVDY